MPELGALTPYHLPTLLFNPRVPAPYTPPPPIAPYTGALSSAQAFANIASTIGQIPQAVQEGMMQGRSMAMQNDLLQRYRSGDPGVMMGANGMLTYNPGAAATIGLTNAQTQKLNQEVQLNQNFINRAKNAKTVDLGASPIIRDDEDTSSYTPPDDPTNPSGLLAQSGDVGNVGLGLSSLSLGDETHAIPSYQESKSSPAQDNNSGGWNDARGSGFGLVTNGKGGAMNDPQDAIDAAKNIPGFNPNRGAFGANIKDPNLAAAAVPPSVLKDAGIDPKNAPTDEHGLLASHDVIVQKPDGTSARLPIADTGTQNGRLDLTLAAYKSLGGPDEKGGGLIDGLKYKIVPRESSAPYGLSDIQSSEQPVSSLANFSPSVVPDQAGLAAGGMPAAATGTDPGKITLGLGGMELAPTGITTSTSQGIAPFTPTPASTNSLSSIQPDGTQANGHLSPASGFVAALKSAGLPPNFTGWARVSGQLMQFTNGIPTHINVSETINGWKPISAKTSQQGYASIQDGVEALRQIGGVAEGWTQNANGYFAPTKINMYPKLSPSQQKIMQMANTLPQPGESAESAVQRAQQSMVVPATSIPHWEKYEAGLQKDPDVKSFVNVDTQLGDIKAAMTKPDLTNSAAMAVLDPFVKSMTGGRATQGQMKLFKGSMPLIDKLQSAYNGLVKGNSTSALDPQQAQDILSTVQSLRDTAQSRLQRKIQADIVDQKAYGIPEASVRNAYDKVTSGGISDDSESPQAPQASQVNSQIQTLQNFISNPKNTPADKARATLQLQRLQTQFPHQKSSGAITPVEG